MPCSSALECYMNDVVDSLEDFVQKSLIIIGVAVASLLLALLYIIKLLSERIKPSENQTNPEASSASNQKSKCATDGDCSKASKKTSTAESSDKNKNICLEKEFVCCFKKTTSEDTKEPINEKKKSDTNIKKEK